VPANSDSRIKVDAADQRAAGVEYSGIDGALGLFFHCQPYRAKLSTTACASRWRSSQWARGEAADQFARCRGCPVGAQHAGQKHFHRSKIYGNARCPRCGSGSTRMIGNRLCISCSNREWEVRRGRNAKGSRPTISLPERRVGLIIDVDRPGEERRIDVVAEHAIDLAELMVAILRIAVGKVAFAQATNGAAISLANFTAFMHGRLPPPTKPKPPRRLLGAARGRRAA